MKRPFSFCPPFLELTSGDKRGANACGFSYTEESEETLTVCEEQRG
jgi:hypothetical protein